MEPRWCSTGRRSLRPAFTALLMVAVVGQGCRSSRGVGDRYFESGRYREAAAAYQAYLATDPDDTERVAHSLFRLGLSHAVPESAVYDPSRAVETMDRLLSLDPNGPHSVEARLIRDLQQKILILEDEVESYQTRIGELARALGDLQAQADEAIQEVADGKEAAEALSREIVHLQREIESLTQEVAERQLELERLKAIDLETPP